MLHPTGLRDGVITATVQEPMNEDDVLALVRRHVALAKAIADI